MHDDTHFFGFGRDLREAVVGVGGMVWESKGVLVTK